MSASGRHPVTQVPDDVLELAVMHLSASQQQQVSLLSVAQRRMWEIRQRKQIARRYRDLPICQAMAVLKPSLPVVPPGDTDFYHSLMATHAEWKATHLSMLVDREERKLDATRPRYKPQTAIAKAPLTMRRAEREAWTAVRQAWETAKQSAFESMTEAKEEATHAAECAAAGDFYRILAERADLVAKTHQHHHAVATAKYQQTCEKVKAMIARDKGDGGSGDRRPTPVDVRVSCTNDTFSMVLMSDRSLWMMRQPCSNWTLHAEDVVRVGFGYDSAAFVTDKGQAMITVLKARDTDFQWEEVDLGNEHAIDVSCHSGSTFFLTSQGSIWFKYPRSLFARITTFAEGESLPHFALISAVTDSDCSIIAADREGRLYYLRDLEDGWNMWPAPEPPSPVRDLFVPIGVPEFAVTFHTGGGVSIRRESSGTSPGGLALLVDGTIWSVLGQRLLDVRNVIHLSRGSSWRADPSIRLTRLEGQCVQQTEYMPSDLM